MMALRARLLFTLALCAGAASFHAADVARLLDSPVDESAVAHKDIMVKGEQSMSAQEAVEKLQDKLPAEVVSWVKEGNAKVQAKGPFTEEALNKARRKLNGMIETATEQLDIKLVECKTFKEKNFEETRQVRADMARLGQTIAAAKGRIVKANAGIEDSQGQIDELQMLLGEHEGECDEVKFMNDEELKILKDDLAVSEFIVKMTECKASDPIVLQQAGTTSKCLLSDGQDGFFFQNNTVSDAAERLKSKHADSMLQFALRASFSNKMATYGGARRPIGKRMSKTMKKRRLALLQGMSSRKAPYKKVGGYRDKGSRAFRKGPKQYGYTPEKCQAACSKYKYFALQNGPDIDKSGKTGWCSCENDFAHATKYGKKKCGKTGGPWCNYVYKNPIKSMVAPQKKKQNVAPARKTPPKKAQMTKCTLSPPNCGLLNDNMSLMWGEVKDSVDELEALMAENAKECKTISEDFNTEIATWQTTLNNYNYELAEATTEQIEDEEEQREKAKVERALVHEFKETWGACTEEIHELLFTNVCGVKSVRGEIAKMSTGSMSPTKILDCEVTDWIPSECSKPCAGGKQLLLRTVVQERSLGCKCPALAMQKRCNEAPCPIACKLDAWSLWGKCSKDCGGGLQVKSRDRLVKPDFGGDACGPTQEERQCGVQSCDVDCVLKPWTSWKPCSRGCGGGLQEKFRRVAKKAEGEGRCPEFKSELRYASRTCNMMRCPSLPECIATSDFVFAVDGSGSMKTKGRHMVFKKFTHKISSMIAMKKGFVGGPGKKPIRGHGQMAVLEFSKEAQIIQPMTDDPKTFLSGLKKLTYLRGITDMGKGLMMADTVLLEGRKEAQSVVVVITDGKPSFQYQTRIAANKLKRQGVRLVFVCVQTFAKLDFIKQLSSFPSRDNVIHVNGLMKLHENMQKEARRVVSTICSHLRRKKFGKSKKEKKGFLM